MIFLFCGLVVYLIKRLVLCGFVFFWLLVISSVFFVVFIKIIKFVYISINYFLINRIRMVISVIRYVFFVKIDNLVFGKSIYLNCILKLLCIFLLLFKIDL